MLKSLIVQSQRTGKVSEGFVLCDVLSLRNWNVVWGWVVLGW